MIAHIPHDPKECSICSWMANRCPECGKYHSSWNDAKNCQPIALEAERVFKFFQYVYLANNPTERKYLSA